MVYLFRRDDEVSIFRGKTVRIKVFADHVFNVCEIAAFSACMYAILVSKNVCSTCLISKRLVFTACM